MSPQTAQHPIGSAFGARSTAAEVLAGIDLDGRTAVVTGGYSGIGLETVRALAAAGADVIVPARRPEQAAEALADIDGAETAAMDLADLASVAAFAEQFLATRDSLDLLINNAGVMANPETRVGDGWESQFATNHLGHYALTNRLAPALTPDARVVALTSTGHKLSGIRWDDVMFARPGSYDKWLAYGQSKTADALFAVHLNALGVQAFAAHPGGIMTPLQRHLPREEMIRNGWIDEAGNVDSRFKSTEQGAATATWASTAPALAGMGGAYCEDCDIAAPSDGARFAGVESHAVDPEQAARLWALSAELTGLDAFSR